jgi:hypothetical protein
MSTPAEAGPGVTYGLPREVSADLGFCYGDANLVYCKTFRSMNITFGKQTGYSIVTFAEIFWTEIDALFRYAENVVSGVLPVHCDTGG